MGGVTFVSADVFDGWEGYTVNLNPELDVNRIDITTPNNDPMVKAAYQIMEDSGMAYAMRTEGSEAEQAFQLPEGSFEQVIAFTSMNTTPDTLVIGKLAEGADEEAVKAALDAHRQAQHDTFSWYLSQNLPKVEDARILVENGYAHGLLAGNALATHDLEGALLHTALGQDIYTQVSQPNGHYNHLDVINKVRRSGSIPQFIEDYKIDNGIMYSIVKNHVPFVLTGSIRDDGPLPEVIGNAYEGQSAMRNVVKKATTVICLATMLHTIATGNMTPSFRVMKDGTIRPVFLYTVDADEFVVNKLLDRGSLSATTVVTNVQDFITIVAKGLGVMK